MTLLRQGVLVVVVVIVVVVVVAVVVVAAVVGVAPGLAPSSPLVSSSSKSRMVSSFRATYSKSVWSSVACTPTSTQSPRPIELTILSSTGGEIRVRVRKA